MRRHCLKTRCRRVVQVATALAAVAFVGCADPPSGSMLSIPPPSGWEERLAGERRAKDEYFRASPDSPLRPEDVPRFAGLDYWPADGDYYFVGRVHMYLEPERFDIVTTSGRTRPCAKVGWVAFDIDGESLRLQVYQLLDQGAQGDAHGFFLPFTDGTTGAETYPAGRYVELRGPRSGPFVLDFNTAYNPHCAYGAPERYVCPVTPPENRLSVRIEAGERGYWKPAAEPAAS